MVQRLGLGSYRRRLDTLAPSVRAACLSCVREPLASLAPGDFVYLPEIVFVAARRRAEAMSL